MSPETRPVLIVGAGPTGLTAAMELSRMGVSIRIVEKMTARSETSRALAVQARTLELLEQRGIGAEMIQLGNQAQAVTLFNDHNTIGHLDLTTIRSRHNYILMLSQAETERLLEERLESQGAHVERGVEMIGWTQEGGAPGGVHAVLRHPDGNLEEVDASWAIAAEGPHSSMRTTAGLPFDGDQGNQRYALGDMSIDTELPETQMSIFIGSNGFAALFPMGAGRFRFITTESNTDATGDPTLEELRDYYDSIAHIPAYMHDLNWSSRFWVNSRHLNTFRSGRVFFGGDAAHIHSPAGGQGMNTGIQDMINLAWKVALVHRGLADPSLMDTYQSERLPLVKQIVSRTEKVTNALNSRDAMTHHLISLGAAALLDLPFARSAGPRMLSETGADYQHSPLSETHHPPTKLKGGDRVPDTIDATIAHGVRTPLYDLLDPNQFTLLVTGDALPTDLERILVAWPVKVQRLELPKKNDDDDATGLGHTHGLTLVRPDAYIAVAAARGEEHRILAWLQHWLPIAKESEK